MGRLEDVGGRGGGTEGSHLSSVGCCQSLGHQDLGARKQGKEKAGRGARKKHLSDLSSSGMPLFICLATALPFWIICAINYAFHLHDLHYSSDYQVSTVWDLGRYINNELKNKTKKPHTRKAALVYHSHLP